MTDAAIARLFDQRDRQAAALATTEARIRAARPAYAANHGLLAFPSIEAMRREVRA